MVLELQVIINREEQVNCLICVLFDMRQLCQGLKNMIHTNLQYLSPGPGLERQTFLYPNTNRCLQMTEILKKKTQQQKTSNVSFLPLNVYTVILLPHRYLLLRPANSCPCAVHNKQDGILGCCSNRYVSIKVCASKHAFLTDPRFLEYLCLSLI